MPNPKACAWYNVDYDKWVKQTTKQIKQHIDLPIEVRIEVSVVNAIAGKLFRSF